MTEPSRVALRALDVADLVLVSAWLREPHVARWWLSRTTIEEELDDIRRSLSGADPVEVLVVELDGRPVGWCQWYRWWDDPDEAVELGVGPDDLGLDYGIGEPTVIDRGVGTAMVGALVRHIRTRSTSGAIVCEPDAANVASCRVLAKNGFELVGVRPLSFEAEDLNAIYRLPPAG
ncbi:MAG: aminoglycoside 6-N-acetyltransferase [Pseudonocardiales bacterium]|jgi:aminoglycoside 6'-N-acetyltransferase|nr:aminoglycoside 6-N-acetyltransferase [Pseudonocardiales bacterium]